ncbi:MAG: helix-turn-helix transcriptional regulator [Clostridia bacterium]|nr:helix-turn-helix transcriptional regulator [Clostridia bacterium]
MTTGEMILYYRKERKLSQEELGQMLSVSRQTISLWETGQTVPTIENLVRLKEIFGVSIDSLLGCAEETGEGAKPEIPKERYRFKFDKKELLGINLRLNIRRIAGWVLVPVLWFVFFAMNVGENSESFIGVIFGVFLVSLFSSVIRIVTFIRNTKRYLLPDSQYTFDYSFYEDRLEAVAEKDGEALRTEKLYYGEIESAAELEKYFVLFIKNRHYVIRKAELDNASAVTGVFAALKCKKYRLTHPILSKIMSTVLFILSIVSWPLAHIVTTKAAGSILHDGESLTEQMNILLDHEWIFFLFIPIPLTSLILGFIEEKRGLSGWKKNIIVGFIFTGILIAFGLFAFFPRTMIPE